MHATRQPLASLSGNRQGQSAAAKTPKKALKHAAKPSFDIDKDGRAIFQVPASPYPQIRARARAATVSEFSVKDKKKAFREHSALGAHRRQSMSRTEEDNLESLLRKYTEIAPEEIHHSVGSQVSTPECSPRHRPPTLTAPCMVRDTPIIGPSNPFNDRSAYNPFPYASYLDNSSRNSSFTAAISGISSTFSTQPPSLASSVAPSRSATYAHLSLPVEQLNAIIINLQCFLPAAGAVPQYKLDTLQTAVNALLSRDDEVCAPTMFHSPVPTTLSSSCGPTTKRQAAAPAPMPDTSREIRHRLAREGMFKFVYEDGVGGESYRPIGQF